MHQKLSHLLRSVIFSIVGLWLLGIIYELGFLQGTGSSIMKAMDIRDILDAGLKNALPLILFLAIWLFYNTPKAITFKLLAILLIIGGTIYAAGFTKIISFPERSLATIYTNKATEPLKARVLGTYQYSNAMLIQEQSINHISILPLDTMDYIIIDNSNR